MSQPTEQDTYRAFMTDTLTRVEEKVDRLDEKVSFTNGKVRKIIIAVVFLAGVLVGLGILDVKLASHLLAI